MIPRSIKYMWIELNNVAVEIVFLSFLHYIYILIKWLANSHVPHNIAIIHKSLIKGKTSVLNYSWTEIIEEKGYLK